ncbi:MAG: NAD-dependent epimerase/dehydratase family protein [Acidobacteriaceae bacterium]|nr:NAD-dependent epimerase/dehydratase family protein [Acidobacteriaceae bacterium]
MRSLVTGGAGFIGSHVARHCLNLGHEVVVLDDLSGGFLDHIPQGARFVCGSVTDQVIIERLFKEGKFDYVYHLAAYAAEGLSHFIRRFNYANNLVGSVNLINESVKHNIRCFVFTSSIAVYGPNQLPMTEELTPCPEDPYGISKYAVELDLKAAHEMFGLDYIVFRPHNVYGEHQNIGDRYRNVLGIFMNQIMRGEPLTIFGDGTQTRAFSYIDDVAPVIARSVERDAGYNQVFNVGADIPYSINELARVVAAAFGVQPEINHVPARKEVLHAYAAHGKCRETFGAGEPVALTQGIERMARWAQSVGSRKSQDFGAVEITKGLPPSWVNQMVAA